MTIPKNIRILLLLLFLAGFILLNPTLVLLEVKTLYLCALCMIALLPTIVYRIATYPKPLMISKSIIATLVTFLLWFSALQLFTVIDQLTFSLIVSLFTYYALRIN